MNKFNQILTEILEGVNDWSVLKDKLETYNTIKTETTQKITIAGKIFEVFAKYYFQTDPSKTELYKNVWLYDEIPLKIKEQLKLPPIDHGIDLLLQDFDEKYSAVQCKFKNNEDSKLSWSSDKIANVFALGTNCDKIIVFTNVSEITEVAKAFEDKFELIDFNELILIKSDVFLNIYLKAKGNQPKQLEKYEPKKHQEIAINKVVAHFSENNRGQLILPCGAGKTLTALWIKEQLKPKTTLILVPSLALLKQIKNDWSRHKNDPYRYICVCSEKDIDKDKKDSVNIHTYEIGGPVTTDPKLVQEFLIKDFDKIIFSTYQSIAVISNASKMLSNFEFDFVICDEAHRTAGSKDKNTFTIIHNNSLLPASKRLYMTATPKVVSKNLKNKLGEDYELLCDMSNPDIFGEEAHRMSFFEAIQEKILVDYKIICIGVTDRQIKKYIDDRNLVSDVSLEDIAHNFALDLVMNKYKAFHAISFHSRVDKAKDFASRHKNFYERVFSENVNGKQTTTHRSKVLRDFENSKIGLVSNARCLTEGVDVPTIDLIYFCDPIKSKIDIVQASGRALRTNKKSNKKWGYIVVPIFHYIDDDVENEIKKKPIFDHLIQVIRSLCDQDERLQAEINNIANKIGKRKDSKIKIEFSDEETEKIVKLLGIEKKVKDVLFDEIIEKTRNYWDVMFKNLIEYKKVHGHTSVTRLQDNYLNFWVSDQRRQNRRGILSKEKKDKLISIDFDWKSENLREQDLDDLWIENYENLIEYIKNHGDTNVPARYSKDGLGNWVVQQRVSKRNGTLNKAREELLNEIGFVWKPRNVFEEFCQELIKFKNKYGHTKVPTFCNDFPELGKWTSKFRIVLNKGKIDENGFLSYGNGKGRYKLTPQQISILKELGFEKSVKKVGFDRNYKELLEYYKKYGNSNPNSNLNKRLYDWSLRLRKNADKLTADQVKMLKDIEFDFSISQKYLSPSRSEKQKSKHKVNSQKSKSDNYIGMLWNKRYNELRKFYKENKHSYYKRSYGNNILYNWIQTQRARKRKGLLSSQQVKLLDEIKFVWDPKNIGSTYKTDHWLEMFNKLKAFKMEFGHTNVSQTNSKFKTLGRWVNDMRCYKKGRMEKGRMVYLPKERELLLDSIGFIWDRIDYKFNLKLDALIEYKGKHGHLNVKPSDEGYKNLYHWLNRLNNAGTTPERIKMLQDIGYDVSNIKMNSNE